MIDGGNGVSGGQQGACGVGIVFGKMRSRSGTGGSHAICVKRVKPGSPAALCGRIRPQDIVESVGGMPLWGNVTDQELARCQCALFFVRAHAIVNCIS